jgi:hypothetical protein
MILILYPYLVLLSHSQFVLKFIYNFYSTQSVGFFGIYLIVFLSMFLNIILNIIISLAYHQQIINLLFSSNHLGLLSHFGLNILFA